MITLLEPDRTSQWCPVRGLGQSSPYVVPVTMAMRARPSVAELTLRSGPREKARSLDPGAERFLESIAQTRTPCPGSRPFHRA